MISSLILATVLSTVWVPPRSEHRLIRRDTAYARGGGTAELDPILLSLSLLPSDSECSGTPPEDVTFTRASAATCIRSDGIAVALVSNQARVHGTLGLLVEGSATNNILNSRASNTTVWTDACTGSTSPGMDGMTNPRRCTPGPVTQPVTVPSGPRTLSVYAKAGAGGDCTLTLKADAEAGPTVTPGATWERYTLTYTSDGSVNVGATIGGTGCDVSVDYWQDEAGSIATSPIVTGGTAAVRAADTAYADTPDASATEGCATVEFAPLWSGPALDVSRTYLSFGNLNNRLGYTNLGSGAENWSAYGGVGNGPVHATAEWVAGVPDSYRTEWSASAGELRAFAVNSATASFSELFSPVTSIQIGGQGGSARAFGHLRNLVLGHTPEACQ